MSLAPAFLPGAGGADPQLRHALHAVSVRLRREIAWLWRERQAQGLTTIGTAELPPFVDAALGTLDLVRFAGDKARFFAEDVTAAHLGSLLTAPAPASPAPVRGSFDWVVQTLALQPVEAFVLALTLLPAVDGSAGPVFACCLNDPGRTEPTLALAQRLWDAPDEVLRCVDPGHALFTHGLITPLAADWHTPLRMPALVARQLLEAAGAPARLRDERRRVIPVVGASDDRLAEMAAHAASQVGLDLLRPGPLAGLEHLRAVMTQAWLRGAALLLPLAALKVPDSGSHDGAVALPLPALPLTVFIGVPERSALAALGEETLPPMAAPPTGQAERLAAWQQAVPSAAHKPVIAELAQRLRCEPAAIARIGAELALLGRVPTDDELRAAARADLDLGTLAQPVTPRFTMDELMLPPAQTHLVEELIAAMRNLARVHHEWGTARAWNEGGLTALFAGPPGTGKTMAAEVIAQVLQLPMYRIDLSQVVNKYIGETEKNLKRLFDKADAADLILFFDEADALFGKRTEVKDAHDRYANLEVSYLLERMERFKGLAILATNRRKDLDEAFLRRLRFVIEFPLPGAAERTRIWRSLIPPGVDASELDMDFLAQRFPLAGGHLRAIVFHACLQSATADAPRRLTMAAVVRAVQREYDKLERACSLDQYGPYAALVAEERIPR